MYVLQKNDISIAHKLPSNNGTPKPVIARFTRRMTKIELITKKKKPTWKFPSRERKDI